MYAAIHLKFKEEKKTMLEIAKITTVPVFYVSSYPIRVWLGKVPIQSMFNQFACALHRWVSTTNFRRDTLFIRKLCDWAHWYSFRCFSSFILNKGHAHGTNNEEAISLSYNTFCFRRKKKKEPKWKKETRGAFINECHDLLLSNFPLFWTGNIRIMNIIWNKT